MMNPIRRPDDELANRLRNQVNLLGSVAHDLRHPLFQLALAVEVASSIDDDRAALASNLDRIRNAVGNIARLVDDLDDYGSLQGGQLRVVRELVRPAAVVRSAVAAFAPMAAKRGIELSERIGQVLPDVHADAGRLHQVMSNLLTNALCMTPPGGSVVVSVAHAEDRVRFGVSDSGPGIRDADFPHLFERCWRGTHGSYLGRGLGLAIARDLVEAHGGEIWAENGSACGAQLSFTVPVSSADRTADHSRATDL